jgi:vitamin B12 transporter
MRRFLSLVVPLFLLAGPAAAGPGAMLTGSVRGPDGGALPHLVLRLSGPEGPRQFLTGPEGHYRVGPLAPGDYTLAVEAPGFRLAPEPRVTLTDGETRLDLALSPAPVREHVLVSATRGEATLSTLGVSATVLDSAAIAGREAGSLLTLVQNVPGVATARTGGVGTQGSTFVRGGEDRFARILLDGIPLNAPGGLYNFGPVLPLELERIEVVRGAASSLYGTDALAGVIHLVTRRAGPDEALGLRAEADAGGFAWRRFSGGASGRKGAVDWSAGGTRLTTDNEQPNSAFEETAAAASLGTRLGEASSLRLATRFATSSVGTPGQTAYGRPDLDATSERDDFVLGVQFRHARQGLAHELRAGFARMDQLSLNPADSGPYVPRSGDRVSPFEFFDFPEPAGFLDDTRRLSAGYQVELQAGDRHLLTAGADLERETGRLGSRALPLRTPERTNLGAYVQDRLLLGGRFFLTLGGRIERNDNYGTRAVPRAALAYRLREGDDAVTLKASAGAGIKEPTFFQTFGFSEDIVGNPDLDPERSRTYDVGIEQRFLGSRLRAEATLFRHEYRDQVAFRILSFTPFRGSYANLGETRGQGVELAVEAAPLPRLSLAAAYTYLDGEVIVSASEDPVYAVGEPLLRRPRHQASFSGEAGAGRATLGATLLVVGRRADSDFSALGLTENEGYARLDVRARVALGRGLEAFAVADNLLDASYEEALGYPALGRSVRAGIRFRSVRPN